MNEKTFSTRQLSIILFVALLGLKLLVLPSLLYQSAGSSGYISLIIGMGLELIALICVIYLMKKAPDKTFFEVMSEMFGKPVAVIINIIFFTYFIVRALYILMETRIFFVETLYENYNWIIFSVPFLLLMWYVLMKSNKVIGRIFEVFYPLIVGLMFIVVVTSISQAKIDALLPICENGFPSVMFATLKNTFWFGDVVILYAFMGKVKQDKNFTSQLIKKYVLALVLLISFMVLYYAIYDNIAGYLKYATSKMVQYSPRTTNMGRLDWLAICLCSFGLVMHYILMVFALKTDVNSLFKLKQENSVSSFIILFVISVASLLLINKLSFIIDLLRTPIYYYLFAIQFILPVILAISYLIFSKVKKKKGLKYATNI